MKEDAETGSCCVVVWLSTGATMHLHLLPETAYPLAEGWSSYRKGQRPPQFVGGVGWGFHEEDVVAVFVEPYSHEPGPSDRMADAVEKAMRKESEGDNWKEE